MAWFEINGNHIVSRDYNPWSEDNGAFEPKKLQREKVNEVL